tara:strand:+ start:3689 stop:4783 length:1095 start_codon:yes stop_codon:yes gene_type:complete
MSDFLALNTPISLEDISTLDELSLSSLSRMKDMRFSITGANGFLASNIIYYLHVLSSSLQLNLHVTALCRSRSRFLARFTSDYFLSNSFRNSNLTYSKYSFTEFPDIPPSQVVIHAASNASPASYSQDPKSTSLVNTLGTINAIEHAKKSNSKCFVYLSTSGIYGFNNSHISTYSEKDFGFIDPADSKNIYIESKRLGECITSTLCSQYNIPFVILRPSINYGPGLNLSDERSISSFLNSAFTCTPITLTSDGLSKRSYLYIKDFMELFIRILCSPCNSPLNIASSHSTKIIDLAKLIHRISDIKNDVNYHINSLASSTFSRVEFDETSTSQNKAKSLYSWRDRVALEEGLIRTLSHYKYLSST